MRFMVLVHATEGSEAGLMPSTELLSAMGKYNEELVEAGVMKSGEGLRPTSRAVRILFGRGQTTVIDGPFAETKELIAGYWIWEAASLEEAVEWVKRCPNPHEGESIIEVRQIYEADEFGDEFTPEARAQEEQFRAVTAAGLRVDAGRDQKVVVLHKSAPGDEDAAPSEEILTAMGDYMQQLAEAGLLLEAEGLHPSAKGARVRFSGARRTVVDGPFTEAKELIAGFSMLRVRSLEEAIEWVKRCPMPSGVESELELRPVVIDDDFGESFTPELREQEARLRTELAERP